MDLRRLILYRKFIADRDGLITVPPRIRAWQVGLPDGIPAAISAQQSCPGIDLFKNDAFGRDKLFTFAIGVRLFHEIEPERKGSACACFLRADA